MKLTIVRSHQINIIDVFKWLWFVVHKWYIVRKCELPPNYIRIPIREEENKYGIVDRHSQYLNKMCSMNSIRKIMMTIDPDFIHSLTFFALNNSYALVYIFSHLFTKTKSLAISLDLSHFGVLHLKLLQRTNEYGDYFCV